MELLNRIDRSKRYMLNGLFKKNGFDRWRLAFTGVSEDTGEESSFFIEFYIVNPLLSPSECVLGFKNRVEATEKNIAYNLSSPEKYVKPSFVMVKVGRLCKNGKQINAYFPSNYMKAGTGEFLIKVGTAPENTCVLTDNATSGSVVVTKNELLEKPELLCSAGSMTWDLHYSIGDSFFPNYRSSLSSWSCFGARSAFGGVVILDGEKFSINTKSSFGYFDKNWGKNFANPFLHLSSSNLTSNISGKKLLMSCFAVQGEYNRRLSILTCLEGHKLEFHAGSHRKYNLHYECTQMPSAENEPVKLHWSVSMNDRKNFIDIDVYCESSAMFVRDYESPDGGRKVLKVLGGGTGIGELKLYQRVRKNLELLEDIRIESCLCEYGNIEYPNK